MYCSCCHNAVLWTQSFDTTKQKCYSTDLQWPTGTCSPWRNSKNTSKTHYVLHKSQEKIDTIHEQVIRGEMRLVRGLLDKKGWANARDHYGHSPLHKTVMANQEDIMRFILERYPDHVEDRDNVSRKARSAIFRRPLPINCMVFVTLLCQLFICKYCQSFSLWSLWLSNVKRIVYDGNRLLLLCYVTSSTGG